MNLERYLVETNPRRFFPDTLDFTYNFWSLDNASQISNAVFDINDGIDPTRKGPYVNFDNFSTVYLKWQ